MRHFSSALLFLCLCSPTHSQESPKAGDQRLLLEHILTQNFPPSEVGKKLMGVGAETDVRRPGAIIVIQREGLFGSFVRNEIASSAIVDLDAKLYRGHKDYAVLPGERFYVTNVHVGPSGINFGLLSARIISNAQGNGRVWTVATFNFPDKVLANAEQDTVLREIDQWFVTEGHMAAPAAPVAASYAPQVLPAAPAAGTAPAKLTPGMSREEVTAALGKPGREIAFLSHAWLHYPGMVVELKDEKLFAVESVSSASVTLLSDPAGAEIYLDDQLAGDTPSTLQIPAGTHKLLLRLAGYEEWPREIQALPGSEIRLQATLARK
jgi:hypothetical protein